MTLIGLREVEKIERFYLSSCTDLPLTSSLHYEFPALDESVYSRPVTLNPSNQTRFPPGSVSEADATLNNNNRAKEAFLKICDSLGAGVTDESLRKNYRVDNKNTRSCHLVINPSMSKDEFIKKLEEGMFRTSCTNESFESQENESPKEFDYKQAKSDSVLAKVMKEAADTNNTSKSTTAIDSNNRQRGGPGSTVSTASKVIFTGFVLLMFFGFVKSVTSSG